MVKLRTWANRPPASHHGDVFDTSADDSWFYRANSQVHSPNWPSLWLARRREILCKISQTSSCRQKKLSDNTCIDIFIFNVLMRTVCSYDSALYTVNYSVIVTVTVCRMMDGITKMVSDRCRSTTHNKEFRIPGVPSSYFKCIYKCRYFLL